MTQLLRKAFEEAGKLPPEAQDALAKALLQDLESEHGWRNAFGAAEEDALGALADEALSEHRNGTTRHLDAHGL